MLSVALLLLAAGSSVKCETLTQPTSVTVQPGQRLTINCQVSYSVSSYWTAWIRQPAGKGLEWIGSIYTGETAYKDSLRSQFSITLVASSKTATLSGQNMQPGDTAVYYCARRSGYFDYWGKGTMVTVTSATPRAPSAFPLTSCGSGTGDMVTLGCLATGFSPSTVTYTWRKDGVDITDFIQYPPVLKDNFYTGVSQLRVRRQDWTANPKPCYTCVATNTAGNGQVTICPKSVYCHPATLRVLTSSSEEDEVSFSCFAKDFSPKDHEFKWLKNNKEVSNKIFEVSTPPKEESKTENGTLYSAASFLTVAKSEWIVGDMFTCKFRGSCENNVSTFKTLNFTYNDCTGPVGCKKADAEIKIIQPSNKEMFEQRKGKIVCQVKQNVPSVTRIWWEDEEENELANSDDASSLKSLSLDITFDEWTRGLKRICKVAHSELLAPLEDFYERKADFLPETDVLCNNALDAEEDNMGNTAITFILLFLITLLFTIGTTVMTIK